MSMMPRAADTVRTQKITHRIVQLVWLEEEPVLGRQRLGPGSGSDYHPEPRPPLTGATRQLRAVHRPRHVDVGE